MCYQVWIVMLTVVLLMSELPYAEQEARIDKGVCTGLTGIEWGNTY
jgi:hypothetical protein